MTARVESMENNASTAANADTTATPATMRPARAFFRPPLPNRRLPLAKAYSESC
jgi:hypothetical protein